MTTLVDDDLLDAALSQLLGGEPAVDVAASYPAARDDLRPLLQSAACLEALQQVETPTADALAADRNAFLAQVTEMQLVPVSAGPLARLKGWISQTLPWPSTATMQPQKELNSMFALAFKFALLLTILAGSLGGTLAAAADSLPDSAVYPIKLAMEQAQLKLYDDPAVLAEKHLALAQARSREIVRLVAKGDAPGEALLVRMQTHLRTAYQLATQTDDEQMSGLLAQAQAMTRASGQELAAAQALAQERTQERMRERLEEAGGLMKQWRLEAAAGLEDPAGFRYHYGPNGPCAGDECEPSFGGEDGGEQHQYGPGGPCEGEDCQPPDGQGAVEQHQAGPGGPCDAGDCEPPYGDSEGEQHQYGPGGPNEGEDCQPPNGEGVEGQQQRGPNDPDEAGGYEPPYGDGAGEGNQNSPGGPCAGANCQPPSGGSNQEQNQEQNQAEGSTENQNQEQNGDHPGDSGGSGSSGGAGGSDDSGGSDGSGGSGGTGESGHSGSGS